MKLSHLRAELPSWEWRAVRNGMGWSYEGTKGQRRVEIRAYAVLTGEDDYETQWRVTEPEKQASGSYASFWMMEEL